MKNKTILKITTCLLAGLLAGCANSEAEKADQPVVITVWNYYNGAQKESFDELVQKFNETEGARDQIIVESVSKGTIPELFQAINDSIDKKVGSDELPQICAAYADTAFEANEKGMVADLSPYLTEEELDEFVDAYVEEGRFEDGNSIKLFPTAKSTEVLLVNMTDFEKFSADTGMGTEEFSTWEGMARVAEAYYKWSGGKAFFGRDAFANYILIGSQQLGHEVFQVENGTMTLDLDKTVMRKLWDNYYVPYVKGYYVTDGKFRSDDLKTGALLAFVGSTTGVTYAPHTVTFEDGNSYDIECRIFPLPNFEGEEPFAVQQGAGMMVLKSNPEMEQASVKFLKWFVQEEQNLEFCIRSGYLPVLKNSNTIEALNRVIEEKQIEMPDLMRQSLSQGIQEVQEYKLYTPKAFKNGTQARDILEYGMSERAKEDRQEILQRIKSGMSPAEAEADFLSDENFEAWLEETNREILALGE